MKKAYLAISYSSRKLFDKEVKSLIDLCKKNRIELLSFVDKYNFKEGEEIEMMKTAFFEIDKSDFLIAELTTKSIGVGIEIGYAKAKENLLFICVTSILIFHQQLMAVRLLILSIKMKMI